MAGGELEPLQRAVAARRAGEEPTEADLAVCESYRWKKRGPEHWPVCWNGTDPRYPQCGHHGSQNTPIAAEVGLGHWDWVVELCDYERKEGGDFGMERGSLSSFYYALPVSAKVATCLALKRLGRKDDAEIVRRSIKSHLAWDALAAFPVARTRDLLVLPDGDEQRAENPKSRGGGAGVTVAVAGMRQTPKLRSKTMTSEDAHSVVLRNALADPADFGLTPKQGELLARTVRGDVDAAEEVSRWMFGTIDKPNYKVWRFQIRRTTEGAQVINFSEHPSPFKPCNAVGQILATGEWRAMQPCPRKMVKGWSVDYAVEVRDGIIHARCAAGEASLPELGGELVWEVNVIGSQVTFSRGKAG